MGDARRPSSGCYSTTSRRPRVPEALVIHSGRGKAARSYDRFKVIVRTLRVLGNDDLMLVLSSRPLGVCRTHGTSPRLPISMSVTAPTWGTGWQMDAGRDFLLVC
jgi:urocanate hydratase